MDHAASRNSPRRAESRKQDFWNRGRSSLDQTPLAQSRTVKLHWPASLLYQPPSTVGPQSLDTGSDSPEAPEAKKVSSVTIHKSSLQPFPVKLDCTEQEAAKNESVYLLPIMAGRVSMYVDEAEEMKCEDPHVEYAGLVLRSVDNMPGHFVRLGIFGFSNQPWEPGVAGRDLYADFSSALEEQGEETAKSVCLETNEDADYPKQRFVIKIK
uniref:Uncharacterized protein n=1 Tax=Bionectria ochroleuca TaxID=29856 RepID=A0A8H7NI84_BIOOC